MNYYDKNMECMKQHRSLIFEKLQDTNLKSVKTKLDQINSYRAKDGDLYLMLEKGEKHYRLNSSYSPSYEAKVWCGQFTYQNMNTVIKMYGFGNGSFAREILKKKEKDDTLFIYEPCLELFLHVLHHYDITDLLQQQKLILVLDGINDIEFHNILGEIVNITNISSQIQCIHPYYDEIFPEDCVTFWREIKDNYYYVITSINTEVVFGKRYITNSIYNTKYLRESYNWLGLKKEFNLDIPIIIVAAGPSLKKNIDDLKKAKGRAYIFAVDRILDYLLDEGVEPDYIVTVDPIKPLEYFTKRTDVKIPLLCIPEANWEVLNRHQGKKIFFCSSLYFYKMFDKLGKEPPILDSGASVATAVFSACLKLGFKRIVLVGQDLAYDGENTHAFGIPEKGSFDRHIFVEGMDGNKVKSRHDWYEFLLWFKSTIALHPETEVIDVKETGAKITGSISMPFREVLDLYCTNPLIVTNVTENLPPTFHEKEMDKVKKFFTDSLDELYQLQRKSKEAIKICESQIREYSQNPEETGITTKNYKKMTKINNYINKQPVYDLIESYITGLSAEYISKLYKFSDDEKADKITTYEKALKIFEAIIEAADFSKPLLEEAIKHI